MRVLAWPGRFLDRTRRHMWVEFVVWFSSLLRGFFSRFSVFPPSTKTITSKFQFDWVPRAARLSVARLLYATLVDNDNLFFFNILFILLQCDQFTVLFVLDWPEITMVLM